MNSIIYCIFHPHKFYERIRWELEKRKLRYCGDNTIMAYDFNLLGHQYIKIGNNTSISNNCLIQVYKKHKRNKTNFNPSIEIGNKVFINSYTCISCINKIVINDGCVFGSNVFVTDNYHGNNTIEECDIPVMERNLYSKGSVIIGKNVWVGKNVCIMPNVKIGDYAIIGANAVVTKDVPEKAIVAGIPAKIIRYIN